MIDELSDDKRVMLALEGEWLGRRPGAKEQAISDRFGVIFSVYYRRLGLLIEAAAALRADPVTVNRPWRLRKARRAA